MTWQDMKSNEKTKYVLMSLLKLSIFILLLYVFLLSLNLMTIGFTLISGYTMKAGPTIKFLLSNPFAALAIGILATAIMQNATATTSIAVAMVGAQIIPDVKSAIPIIMGANIGTCVTNALIALTLNGDKNEFKRAFSGATLNDGFNLLTTVILLPIEICTHVMFIASKAIVNILPLENASLISQANFMAALLDPIVANFIRFDMDAVERVSQGSNETRVALRCCQKSSINSSLCVKECHYWLMPMIKSINESGTGLVMIVSSIIIVIACLFGIVKVLSFLIAGPISKAIRVAVNASFPGRFKWLTEVLLFSISLLITIIVQSSNIVTATLVPLCGIGIVTLQRVYTLTLGANIGTTVTGILTAFTLPPSSLEKSLQLAFIYTFFNLIGVILWLPIPKLRLPKVYAEKLGEIVIKYKWFVVLYVLFVYFIMPLVIFALALVPYWIGLGLVGIPILCIIVFLIIFKCLKLWCPKILHKKIQNFSTNRLFYQFLDSLDRHIQKLPTFKCKATKKETINFDTNGVESCLPEDHDITFTSIVRKMSVVEPIVQEARLFSRRNSLSLPPLPESLQSTETLCRQNSFKY